MISRKLSLALAPALIFLASCGDSPEGKFQDDNKKTSKDNDQSAAKFLDNPSVTKWEASWPANNVIVYHWRGEPDDLHPTNGKSNPRRVVLDYTQRFLISTDLENQGIRPDLVKQMPTVSADGLRYDFELRDEPVWDDGSPLTSDDVEFTLKAWLSPYTDNGFARPYFETFATLEKDASNPKKFTVVFSRKYIGNLGVFGDVAIMQKKYYDPNGVFDKYSIAQLIDPAFAKSSNPELKKWSDNFNDIARYGRDINNLAGLGAYKVTAWEEKQRIELTRKPNHWTSKVKNPNMYDTSYPEKIIFKINTDENSISLEMKKQVIDVSTWLGTTTLAELQKNEEFNRNYYSAFMPNFNYTYIGMNLKPEAANRKPFFTDKKVRRAMALLVPADQMNQAYIEGKALRMSSLVSPVKVDVYNTDLKPVPFDIAEAKKLLDEAGWKDTDGDNIRDKMINGQKTPFEFEMLLMSGNQVTPLMAKDIQAAMYKAGVKANIRTLEFVAFYDELELHHFDMYFGAWGSTSGAEDYKQIWHSSSWLNKGSNYAGFGNSRSDSLIEKIRVTIDDKERIVLEKQLQEIVYDEQPYIFLYSVPAKIAVHKRLDNADFYYDKPGVYLSNLRPMTASTMATQGQTP